MSISFRNKYPNCIGKKLTDVVQLEEKDEKGKLRRKEITVKELVKEFTMVRCSLEEKKTREEFAKELDINRIIDKYTKTGVLPFQGHEKLGMYADVSELPDYRSSLDFLIKARDTFMKMDVNVRNRFDNNPAKLIDFLKNPENREEGIKLGLVDPNKKDGKVLELKKEEMPMKVEVVNPQKIPEKKET